MSYFDQNEAELRSLITEWGYESEIDLKTYIERTHRIIDLMKKFKNKTFSDVSPAFFRGQSKSCFKLESTLERKRSPIKLDHYYYNILKILPILESHRGDELDNHPESIKYQTAEFYNENLNCIEDLQPKLPMIKTLVFLRHHGYPSPLLDWSFSPYVALYFAMKTANPKTEDPSEMPAVYVFIKTTSGITGGNGLESQILQIDRNIRTTKRHYNQQACYTICAKIKFPSNPTVSSEIETNPKSQKKEFYFERHEEVFQRSKSNNFLRQDFLIKFTIKDDRKQVMDYLNYMNINDYTLFNSTDSLVYWLAESGFEDIQAVIDQKRKSNILL